MRATAAGLDGDAIIFVRIEQVEAGHRCVAKIIEATRMLNVDGLQITALEISEHPRPEWLPFPNDDARAMFLRFLRHRGNMQPTHDHRNVLAPVEIRDFVGFINLSR